MRGPWGGEGGGRGEGEGRGGEGRGEGKYCGRHLPPPAPHLCPGPLSYLPTLIRLSQPSHHLCPGPLLCPTPPHTCPSLPPTCVRPHEGFDFRPTYEMAKPYTLSPDPLTLPFPASLRV